MLCGILLGTVLGTLVHSSAATVMLVGFVNAGLLSLAETVPAMLGANIGTTISMQAVSLKLGDYCFFAIALGFALSAIARTPRTRQIGRVLLGFGLLFLGMNVMSERLTWFDSFYAFASTTISFSAATSFLAHSWGSPSRRVQSCSLRT